MKTKILFEDGQLLIVHKPAGLATQSASVTMPDVESELRTYLKGKPVYTVHRLDQPVEGILAFAKTKEAAAALTAQFSGENTCTAAGAKKDATTGFGAGKIYHALVCGTPSQSEGILVHYLRKNKQGLGEIAKAPEGAHVGEKDGASDAKRAELSYKILEHAKINDTDVTLIEIELHTGRFHQIRLQMKAIGCPIVGDRKYGGELATETATKAGLRFPALCALRLSLVHPVNKKEMSWEITPEFEETKVYVERTK